VSLGFSKILLPSLQLLLRQRIQNIIDSRPEIISNTNSEGSDIENEFAIDLAQLLNQIPLNKVKDTRKVWYVSAIAFKLAQIYNRDSSIVAQRIIEEFNQPMGHTAVAFHQSDPFFLLEDVWESVRQQSLVWVKPPGWICWQFNDIGLATWLQKVIDQPLSWGDRHLFNQSFNKDNHFLRNSTNSLFLIQHSHARCCSLLRLAHCEQIICLAHADGAPSILQILTPKPIPWLTTDQTSNLTHAAEQALISDLITTIDHLYDLEDVSSILKLAQTLSQGFQNFHAACPIFGEIKTANLAIAQARLGLVLATQILLCLILQDIMGQPAPLEL
jgi:arginyl-tRNA synthetase